MNEKEEKVDFIKWFSELDKNSINLAGGKGANLGEMYNTKVNVPPGFVVTAQAYDYFIKKAGLKEQIDKLLEGIEYEDTKELNKTTEKIRGLIERGNFPKEMQEEILESYELLDTNNVKNIKGTVLEILKSSEPIFVAVRSSATAEDLAEASFSGQQETFLNVKGSSELLTSIKKCIASLFTSRAAYYRHKKGYEHVKTSLAVVVQRMIDSDKSGVIFSKDPTNRTESIIIEAVFGLGEGIVSGTITPDKYLVSRDLKILEKNISDKKVAITRSSSGSQELVKLSEEKSNQQVLKEYEIKKLAEISLKLEEHYKKPQDIEFAIEGGEIYIVQTRAVTTIGKKIEDKKIGAKITEEGGLTAHAAIVSREMGIPAVVGTREATTKLKDGEVITVDGSTGKINKGRVEEKKQKEIQKINKKKK